MARVSSMGGVESWSVSSGEELAGSSRGASSGAPGRRARAPRRSRRAGPTWPHLELGPQDDRGYVEQLIKAIFQAGLTWPTTESQWPAFSEVFDGFDPVQVAAMSEQDINRALQNTRIIRNHRKVKAAVTSAAATNEVVAQYGSFDAYLRSFDSPEKEIADLGSAPCRTPGRSGDRSEKHGASAVTFRIPGRRPGTARCGKG